MSCWLTRQSCCRRGILFRQRSGYPTHVEHLVEAILSNSGPLSKWKTSISNRRNATVANAKFISLAPLYDRIPDNLLVNEIDRQTYVMRNQQHLHVDKIVGNRLMDHFHSAAESWAVEIVLLEYFGSRFAVVIYLNDLALGLLAELPRIPFVWRCRTSFSRISCLS